MKKNVMRLGSALMATTMLFSTSAFAAAGTIDDASALSQTASGSSTVTNPTYNVTVPTATAITIDAFEVGSKGQVYSGDFVLTNASNVPVKISVAADASVSGSDVNIKASKNDVNQTDTNIKTKDISLEILAEDTAGDLKYSVPVDSTSKKAELAVKLDKTSGTVTTTKLAIGGFANAGANWSANDVKVDITYTVMGLTTAMDAELVRDPSTKAVVAQGPTVTSTATLSSGSDATYTLSNMDTATVSKITIKDVPVGAAKQDVDFAAETYTVSGSTITIKADSTQMQYMLQNKASYVLKITLSDGTVLTATLVVA